MLLGRSYKVFFAVIVTLLFFIISRHLSGDFPNKNKVTEDVLTNTITTNKTLSNSPYRITFLNDYIKGSINLQGGKIDDLILVKYKENIDYTESVRLLSPLRNKTMQYAEFGWISDCVSIDLPCSLTYWVPDTMHLTKNSKLTLKWTNNTGIEFRIVFSLDDRYVFMVEQFVLYNNNKIMPFSAISKDNSDVTNNEIFLHQGILGVFNKKLKEVTFQKLESMKKAVFTSSQKGWVGFSTKYWLTSMITSRAAIYSLSSYNVFSDTRYQVDVLHTSKNYAKTLFFAGAKKLSLLDKYANVYGIPSFDRSVDLGILYFITKPIFLLLNFFYSLTDNFGLAILLLTVLIKLMFFPLSYKSFVAIEKLKKLHPVIENLKKIHNGHYALQQAMLDLYTKEKVSPISGFLPMILQWPILFALYKVLYVTIEMRQAPFLFWITDLSSEDPTNIFTLFGFLPWIVPSFMKIGILPILMSLTIFLQQKFNDNSHERAYNKITQILPIVFLFLFASFPSGLILYWSWSNILSLIKQIIIKRIYGYK